MPWPPLLRYTLNNHVRNSPDHRFLRCTARHHGFSGDQARHAFRYGARPVGQQAKMAEEKHREMLKDLHEGLANMATGYPRCSARLPSSYAERLKPGWIRSAAVLPNVWMKDSKKPTRHLPVSWHGWLPSTRHRKKLTVSLPTW